MIPTQELVQYPVFGDNSDKEQPDDPKYAAGFDPGDVLPAEWLNWFLNRASGGITKLNAGTLSMEQELNSILTAAGITPSEGNVTQLLDALMKKIPRTISEDTTLTPAIEINVVINTAGVVLTLGNGPYAGYELPVLATANCTVSYNSGTTDTLTAGQKAVYTWNGTSWISETIIVARVIDKSGRSYSFNMLRRK